MGEKYSTRCLAAGAFLSCLLVAACGGGGGDSGSTATATNTSSAATAGAGSSSSAAVAGASSSSASVASSAASVASSAASVASSAGSAASSSGSSTNSSAASLAAATLPYIKEGSPTLNNATFNNANGQLSIDGLTLQFSGNSTAITLTTSGYTTGSANATGSAQPNTDGVMQICKTGGTYYGGIYNLITADSYAKKGFADIAEVAGKTFYELAKCTKPTKDNKTSWIRFNADGSAVVLDSTASTPAQQTVTAADVQASLSDNGAIGTPTVWNRLFKIQIGSSYYYVMFEADTPLGTTPYGSIWVESALIK